MKKETIEVFVCDFCGLKHENEDWMSLHEQVCNKNPINMPCSECEHQIIGIGCSVGMNEDIIGGNIKCFYYKKGKPKSLNTLILDGDDNV